MITKLRKTHRKIWFVIAIALPILFIAAYISIPEYQLQEERLTNNTIEETSITTKVSVNAELMQDELDNYTVKLSVYNYLPSAAANIYLTNIELNDYVKNSHLIGTVNGTGEYSFAIKPEILEPHHNFIVMYDPIKEKELYNPIRIEE